MTVANFVEGKPVVLGRPRMRMNRKHLAIALGAVIVGGVAAMYGRHWWTIGRFVEATDDAYVGGDITVMAPKVAGLITQVPITDNQEVHAGDLLIKIDDRDYKAALAKAEANVSEQHAVITNLDAQRNMQDAVIAQAKAGIAATDAETSRTHDDFVRYRELSNRSAAPIQMFQKAESDYKQATANGEKSRATLDAVTRQLDVIATLRRKAEASLAQAQAEQDIAKLNIEYTEVRAPIDGTVGNRSARVGSYATVGSQLVSIVPSHGLWVDANFKENQLAHMHAGEEATIRADVLPGRVLHGRVLSLAPATGAQFSILPAENATGNFTKIVQRVPVRILLDDDASTLGVLRPGLSVIADVNQKDHAE